MAYNQQNNPLWDFVRSLDQQEQQQQGVGVDHQMPSHANTFGAGPFPHPPPPPPHYDADFQHPYHGPAFPPSFPFAPFGAPPGPPGGPQDQPRMTPPGAWGPFGGPTPDRGSWLRYGSWGLGPHMQEHCRAWKKGRHCRRGEAGEREGEAKADAEAEGERSGEPDGEKTDGERGEKSDGEARDGPSSGGEGARGSRGFGRGRGRGGPHGMRGGHGHGHHEHGHPHEHRGWGRHGRRGGLGGMGPGGMGSFDLNSLVESLGSNPMAQQVRAHIMRCHEDAIASVIARQGDLHAQQLNPDVGADNTFIPPVDIFSTETAYILHIALPGAKKEDVGINWDAGKGVLTIAGVIHRPGDEEFLKTLTKGERKTGMFEREIKLPPVVKAGEGEGQGGMEDVEIDGDAILAKLENGVLIVTVHKVEKEWTEVKKIDIE